jgi:hypothetical protein
MIKQLHKLKRTPAFTGHSAVRTCAKHVFMTTLVLRTVKTARWSVP